MYGDQFGELVCGYWGLKGYRTVVGWEPLYGKRGNPHHIQDLTLKVTPWTVK